MLASCACISAAAVASFADSRALATTRSQWESAAEAWHRWGPFLGEWLGPATERMLDLAAVGRDEAIILCPANHSPPTRVAPYPGAPGYEAVATCLAPPEVRARTEGVIAMRPPGGVRPQVTR